MDIHTREVAFEDQLLDTFGERRMFIMPGTTSGRYGIDTLAALAMMHGPDAVYEGAVFAFCHRSEKQIRFLLWEDGGYWLITRKIYNNTFSWPEAGTDGKAIAAAVSTIRMILHSPGYGRKAVMERCSKMAVNDL